eukprot:5337026-Pyramimonas_sp.AAC.1
MQHQHATDLQTRAKGAGKGETPVPVQEEPDGFPKVGERADEPIQPAPGQHVPTPDDGKELEEVKDEADKSNDEGDAAPMDASEGRARAEEALS